MQAMVQRSCGLDVHKKSIVATMLLETSDGSLQEETKEFGTTLDACTSLANWLSDQNIHLTVMESTGIYWKNIYAALEKRSLPVSVVNARHVKQVLNARINSIAKAGDFSLRKKVRRSLDMHY